MAGGARHYVEKIMAGIADKRLNTPVRARSSATRRACTVASPTHGAERFDKVVMATHSDQALALLRQPRPQERRTLGAIRYQPNRAVLHTDASVLPATPAGLGGLELRARAGHRAGGSRVCLHYLLNMLQPLPLRSRWWCR